GSASLSGSHSIGRFGWLHQGGRSARRPPQCPRAAPRRRSRRAQKHPPPLAEAALGGTAWRPGIYGRAHVLVAEVDAALVAVVGGHFHGYAVAGQDADAVLFHAPGGVGDDFMPIVELH